MNLTIKRIQTTWRVHHLALLLSPLQCRLFVFLYNITCCGNRLLPRVDVNTTKLLDATCTLVTTSVILQSFTHVITPTFSMLELQCAQIGVELFKPAFLVCPTSVGGPR